MRRLTPSQAYKLGYIRAYAKCSEDLRVMKQNFDHDVADLQEKRLADLRALSQKFDAMIAHLKNEFADVAAYANELRRNKIKRAAEDAINERALISDQWLN